ncbi:MAG: hypothetical protein V2A73_08790 [Pseudomonadota bacterium]
MSEDRPEYETGVADDRVLTSEQASAEVFCVLGPLGSGQTAQDIEIEQLRQRVEAAEKTADKAIGSLKDDCDIILRERGRAEAAERERSLVQARLEGITQRSLAMEGQRDAAVKRARTVERERDDLRALVSDLRRQIAELMEALGVQVRTEV